MAATKGESMKHEDLILAINKDIDEAAWAQTYYPFKMLQALRSVVELHHVDDNNTKCWHCYLSYPCPTIEVVIKELSNG
jgi:hypothetical protein